MSGDSAAGAASTLAARTSIAQQDADTRSVAQAATQANNQARTGIAQQQADTAAQRAGLAQEQTDANQQYRQTQAQLAQEKLDYQSRIADISAQVQQGKLSVSEGQLQVNAAKEHAGEVAQNARDAISSYSAATTRMNDFATRDEANRHNQATELQAQVSNANTFASGIANNVVNQTLDAAKSGYDPPGFDNYIAQLRSGNLNAQMPTIQPYVFDPVAIAHNAAAQALAWVSPAARAHLIQNAQANPAPAGGPAFNPGGAAQGLTGPVANGQVNVQPGAMVDVPLPNLPGGASQSVQPGAMVDAGGGTGSSADPSQRNGTGMFVPPSFVAPAADTTGTNGCNAPATCAPPAAFVAPGANGQSRADFCAQPAPVAPATCAPPGGCTAPSQDQSCGACDLGTPFPLGEQSVGERSTDPNQPVGAGASSRGVAPAAKGVSLSRKRR